MDLLGQAQHLRTSAPSMFQAKFSTHSCVFPGIRIRERGCLAPLRNCQQVATTPLPLFPGMKRPRRGAAEHQGLGQEAPQLSGQQHLGKQRARAGQRSGLGRAEGGSRAPCW